MFLRAHLELTTHFFSVWFNIQDFFFFLQALDFSITDFTSETDEIPDIIALEEEDGPNHSHANGPEPSQGKMLNN